MSKRKNLDPWGGMHQAHPLDLPMHGEFLLQITYYFMTF